MGYRGTIGKTSFTLGEISPRALGLFDQDKPIWRRAASKLENFLVADYGYLNYRPGTMFVGLTKNSANKVCLYRFTYSIVQEYVMEVGNLYIRFFSNVNGSPGQVIVPSAPAWMTATPYVPGQYVTFSGQIYFCLIAHTSGVFATDLANGDWVLQNLLEIPTVFQQADIFNLQTANNADVMYIANENYPPQKLIRTSATSFTISDVPFVRGPFLDTNITTTTITPSADTGTGITLMSSSALFQTGHIGSLWRIKNGVVKITAFSSSTSVTADVQAEPNGTPGNLGTSASATKDWAEGAFSHVRGFPSAVTFHEGRLIYGKVQTIYGSVVDAFDDFSTGTAQDSDAWIYEIGSNVVNVILWLRSNIALKIGTSGGTITAADQGSAGITPSSPPLITIDTQYGVLQASPAILGGFLFYLQDNGFSLRMLRFDWLIQRDKADNMNYFADHILRDGGGAVQMDRQQSPSDRIWVIRKDGQIAVLVRDFDQQVAGWSRMIGGESDGSANCNGLSGGFETICILPISGQDDQVWVVCQRRINGTYKRFVEVFTNELFNNYWEPVRMDASLSYDNPLNITAISNTNPIVVTSPAHGFSNGDLVRIDGVIGLGGFLNGKVFMIGNVTTDTFALFSA